MILLPVLAVTCIGAFIGFNYISSLPEQAEEAFGPATPRLGFMERHILAYRLLQAEDQLESPQDPLGVPTPFTVELGDAASVIVEQLAASDLIDDPELFSAYLRYGGKDRSIQAGEYLFSRAMSPIDIAEGLQDATPAEVTFRVLPGWRMEEIAAALPTSGLSITPDQFLREARNNPQDYSVGKFIPAGGTLEGFFVPGEYEIPREETTQGLIRTLVDGFEAQLGDEIMAELGNSGLGVHEAIKLASIVEREAVVIEEAPQIASVYLNRLAAGMKLDADPTVQYAVGYNRAQASWWTNPLSLKDLEFNSPYNTYIFPGLPPGPIANPGPEAVRAVAFPAETHYFFFRAACDGSGLHNFSSTFQEHLSYGCEGDNE
ncbi:MAG: endolytic transglycosylase MltG [Anaerolineales bacterium]|nr:endolytic transglycosylase MltG [Anaerolineales bacterium]